MKLKHHYLKGLTVFHEPVEIRFGQLPEGLIAITGPNGHGKTSLLESIFASLYRYLPSRDGALHKWCAGRDAQLALTMDFNGHEYEARVLIDAQAGKDEAYLKEDGKPLVNGKVTAFGKEIDRIFGSPDFILSSLFSTQKKNGSFSRIPVAERKALFTDLLGLGHYPDLEDKAKKELARETLELERLRGEQQSLQAQLATLREVQTLIQKTKDFQTDVNWHLDRKNTELADLQDRLKEIDQQLIAFGNLGAQLQETNAAVDQAKGAIQDVQIKIRKRQEAIIQEVESRYKDAQTQAATFERERQDLRFKVRAREQGIEQSTRDLQASIAKLEESLKDWNERRRNNGNLILNREQILAAAAKKADLLNRQVSLDQELSASIAADKKHQQILFNLSDARAQLNLAEQKLETSRFLVAELETIPCQGREAYASCPKILSAVSTRGQLPEMVGQIRGHAEKVRDLELESRNNGHRAASAIQSELTDLRNALAEVEKLVRFQPGLEQAETRIKELDELIQTATEAKRMHESQIVDANTGDEVLAVLFNREKEVERQLGIARLDVDTLHQDLLSLEQLLGSMAHPDALLQELVGQKKAAEDLKAQLEQRHLDLALKLRARGEVYDKKTAVEIQSHDAQRSRNSLQTECAKWTAELQNLETRRAELEKTAELYQESEQHIAEHQQEISDWTLLAKALGKDGIPALEIDAAGPGISAIVNDLLSHCFSSRFAIDLQTQRLSADGKRMLEDFDIRVLDNRRGAWGSIGGLSGGEEVVVNEAIGFGIAIYNKSSRRFETAFRDETTGSLDPVAAVAYVDMLKRARVLGNFSQILFITHNAECAELADARIHCEDGKVTIQ